MGMATGTATGTTMASRPSVLLLIPLGIGAGFLTVPAEAGEWKITPTISAYETITDNVNQTNKNQKNDFITDITPGINISGVGDRAKLSLDYQMHNLMYARETSKNNLQNSLSAFGSLEAVENFFFIDASASIYQQNLSAFRGATYSNVDVNSSNNTSETRSYLISPYIRGTFGSFAEYQLRYNLSSSTSSENNRYNADTKEVVARLAGIRGATQFGWAVDASSRKIDYQVGRDNEADLLRGTLTYHYSPQLRLLLIGGYERNDYASVNKESHTIKGAGFEWAPTERTLLSASREDRFFGGSNNISFSHRTAGTAWNYRETKDAYVATDQANALSGTYFGLYDSMFSSMIPDPVTRAAFVNSFLLSNGLTPDAQLQGGFATTGVTLRHQRELSFALLGARNTVTFAATWSKTKELSQGIGTGLLLGTDFGDVDKVRQQGLSVNWSHKLTGLSSLTGGIARLESRGSGGSSVSTDQTMLTVNFLTQLGPQTSAGVGIRRTEFDGSSNSSNYTENALTGSITHRF